MIPAGGSGSFRGRRIVRHAIVLRGRTGGIIFLRRWKSNRIDQADNRTENMCVHICPLPLTSWFFFSVIPEQDAC